MSDISFLYTKNDSCVASNTGRKEFSLTPREQEVQTLLTVGMTNKMIAKELDISEGTVKVHVKNLMRKLQTKSRLEVALMTLAIKFNTPYEGRK